MVLSLSVSFLMPLLKALGCITLFSLVLNSYINCVFPDLTKGFEVMCEFFRATSSSELKIPLTLACLSHISTFIAALWQE